MPTFDTDPNLTVNIYDGVATVGSDYNTSGVTANIHLPLSKIVWGDESTSRRVSAVYPLPVDIMSITGFSGTSASFGITGSVHGLGTFIVGNTAGAPLYIAGIGITNTSFPAVNVYGQVQGITSGILVGITTTAIAFSNTSIGVHGISGATLLGISGTVTVTGERLSSYVTDSISVVGVSLGSNVVTSYTKDSVAIRGSGGELYIPTILSYMNGATLTALGTSGDILKVKLVDSGVTFSFSVASTVGVTNDGGPLKIQGGTTADNPVYIKFYDDSTYIPTKIILGATGASFETQLSSIKTNTDKLSNINDKLSSNTFNVKVVEVTKPRNLISGSYITTSSAKPLAPVTASLLKSGVNIKSPSTNKSTVFIGNSLIVATPSLAYPLEPGESIFLEVDNLSSIYCYASIDAGAQKIIYIAT